MRVYSGRVIALDVDTVTFPDGSTGELEIIRHPGAAAVVPLLSDPAGPDPTILMLRQYRYATGGTLWEVPAGTLAAGEEPAACARRELEEEAGVRAGRLELLTTIWTRIHDRDDPSVLGGGPDDDTGRAGARRVHRGRAAPPVGGARRHSPWGDPRRQVGRGAAVSGRVRAQRREQP